MGRSRRRRPRFRAWGLLLVLLIGFTVWQKQWLAAVIFGGALVFYLLAWRTVRCRVETKRHTPCDLPVRGFIGSCEWHAGHKKGLPALVRSPGFAGLPRFMWRRDFAAGVPRPGPVPSDPQPVPAGGNPSPGPESTGRDWYEWVIISATVVGTVVGVITMIQGLLPK